MIGSSRCWWLVFVFLKYRWLELLYLFSGHFVVVLSIALSAVAIASASPSARERLMQDLAPYMMPLGIGIFCLTAIFSFALLCSLSPVLLMLGYPEAAENLYRLTLSLRKASPLGNPRVHFWTISIANCLREQGRFEEAEALYKSVIDAPHQRDLLDALTNHGLADAAAENYVRMLQLQNRSGDAEAVRKLIGRPLIYLRLKYALVSSIVLLTGVCFAFWLQSQVLDLMK